MGLLQRHLMAYSLAFFRGLRLYSGWLARRPAATSPLVVLSGILLASLPLLLPRWILMLVSAAGTVPILCLLFAAMRGRSEGGGE